jgi:tRNA-Thr(GGU) m(6)t(6)A37 methyltransferase TsaA
MGNAMNSVTQKQFSEAAFPVNSRLNHRKLPEKVIRLIQLTRAIHAYAFIFRWNLIILTIIIFSAGGCMKPSDTGNEQTAQTQFQVYPIGKVVKENDKTMIVIDKKYQPGLLGLEKHSHVHVVYWFDKNDTPEKRAILQVHPRGNKQLPLTGVFATHSPFRPNLIAITKCNIISIHENVIEIEDIDAFDGSPVLDLKGDFFMFNPK